MKNWIFSFVWAAICAWTVVKVLLYFNLAEKMPWAVGFIHNWGFSAKTVYFLVIFFFFWITGLNKFIGSAIRYLIGSIVLIVVLALVCYFGYAFLTWLIGTL
jgi:hypothetical protein